MFQFSAMPAAAWPSPFALPAVAPALWWRSSHGLALSEAIGPEGLVWELLPPANAPPGSAGGIS